jgi:hypothetical protein
MRDPNRIPKVLAALAKVWYKNPDWRLGQLVVNACGVPGRRDGGPDPFYIEDEALLEGLAGLDKLGH